MFAEKLKSNVFTAFAGMILGGSLLTASAKHVLAADFTGQWVGSTGTVQLFIDGQDQGTAPCHSFDFTWQQSPQVLELVQGYWHCGDQLVFNAANQPYEIREQELWLYGEPAGMLSQDAIELTGEQSHAVFQMVDSNTLKFTSTWSDGFTKFIVNGTMTARTRRTN